MDEGQRRPPQFGGKAGDPVPADPADIKTVRQIEREAQARHPGKQIATGIELLKRISTPGADIPAIGFRASFPGGINLMAPEPLARFSEDAVCRAAATVPAQWIGVGVVRQDPPLDVNEFLRLCGEETA